MIPPVNSLHNPAGRLASGEVVVSAVKCSALHDTNDKLLAPIHPAWLMHHGITVVYPVQHLNPWMHVGGTLLSLYVGVPAGMPALHLPVPSCLDISFPACPPPSSLAACLMPSCCQAGRLPRGASRAPLCGGRRPGCCSSWYYSSHPWRSAGGACHVEGSTRPTEGRAGCSSNSRSSRVG